MRFSFFEFFRSKFKIADFCKLHFHGWKRAVPNNAFCGRFSPYSLVHRGDSGREVGAAMETALAAQTLEADSGDQGCLFDLRGGHGLAGCPNLGRLVLFCIGADFCDCIFILQNFSSSLYKICALLHRSRLNTLAINRFENELFS